MNARFADRLWQSQRTPLHTRPKEEQWYSRKTSSGQCIRKYCHCTWSHVHCSHVISQETFPVRQLEWMWSSASPDYKRRPDQFQRDANMMIVLDMLSMLPGLGFATSSWGTANRFWKITIYIFPRFYSMGWGLRKDLLNDLCPKGDNALARRTFEGDLQVLPRLHICIWYHRLDEFRTGSAHFCAVCDGLTIHFWELIYRVQLLSSMCVFLNWFFLEGTALQYVLRTWSLVDRTFRRVGMWNIGIKGLPAILRPGGFCGSQQCWQVFFGHWPGFGSKTSCKNLSDHNSKQQEMHYALTVANDLVATDLVDRSALGF